MVIMVFDPSSCVFGYHGHILRDITGIFLGICEHRCDMRTGLFAGLGILQATVGLMWEMGHWILG